MQEKILKYTAIFTILFGIFAAILMGWFQWNRESLVRADAMNYEAESMTGEQEEVVSVDTASDFIRVYVDAIDENGQLQIAFPEEIQLQESSVRYDYVNRYIYLWLPQISKNTLTDSNITADDLLMKTEQFSARRVVQEEIEGMELTIPLLGYYSCEITTEQNMLHMTFLEIKPSPELTIVLDAGHGGTDIGTNYGEVVEKDVTLKIIQKLEEKLEGQEARIYCTRYDDTESSQEARVAFANAIRADMLISVHLELMEEERTDKKTGLTAVYNSRFFIPEFGSIDLANILEQETIQKMGGVANGLAPAEEEDVLVSEAKVPVASLEIDSMIQEQRLKAFQSDAYLECIAEGIYQGILKAEELIQ